MFGLSDFQVVWFALGSVANTDQHLIRSRSPWFANVSADSDANLWGHLGIESTSFSLNWVLSKQKSLYRNSLDSEMTVFPMWIVFVGRCVASQNGESAWVFLVVSIKKGWTRINHKIHRTRNFRVKVPKKMLSWNHEIHPFEGPEDGKEVLPSAVHFHTTSDH